MKTRINYNYATRNGEHSFSSALDYDAIDDIPEDVYQIQTGQEVFVANGGEKPSTLLYVRTFYIGEKISLHELAHSQKVSEECRKKVQELLETIASMDEKIKRSLEIADEYILVPWGDETVFFECKKQHVGSFGTEFFEKDYCFPSVEAAKNALRNMLKTIELINDSETDLSDKFPYSVHFQEGKHKKK